MQCLIIHIPSIIISISGDNTLTLLSIQGQCFRAMLLWSLYYWNISFPSFYSNSVQPILSTLQLCNLAALGFLIDAQKFQSELISQLRSRKYLKSNQPIMIIQSHCQAFTNEVYIIYIKSILSSATPPCIVPQLNLNDGRVIRYPSPRCKHHFCLTTTQRDFAPKNAQFSSRRPTRSRE